VDPVLRPCDPDSTLWLLRHALDHEDVRDLDLGLVFELVAQLVVDLGGLEPQ
jgi:hypothetical protein